MAQKKKAHKESVPAAADVGESLEEALTRLSPEEARLFVSALKLAGRKRRIMLVGHLLAILSLVLGFLWALYMIGSHPGRFMAWAFLVPFALAGACLVIFGRMARNLKAREP